MAKDKPNTPRGTRAKRGGDLKPKTEPTLPSEADVRRLVAVFDQILGDRRKAYLAFVETIRTLPSLDRAEA